MKITINDLLESLNQIKEDFPDLMDNPVQVIYQPTWPMKVSVTGVGIANGILCIGTAESNNYADTEELIACGYKEWNEEGDPELEENGIDKPIQLI